LVRALLAAREDGAGLRLDGDDLDAGDPRLQHTADAGDGAARADAGNDRVNLAAGVLPDLLGRRALVHQRVGGVVELSWDDGVRQLLSQLLGAGDGGAHAAGGR